MNIESVDEHANGLFLIIRNSLMSDVFRKEYKALSEEQKNTILSLKSKAEELLNQFELIGVNKSIDPRSVSLAKTYLEQSIMWIVKAATE